jgi:hypothetical protein
MVESSTHNRSLRLEAILEIRYGLEAAQLVPSRYTFERELLRVSAWFQLFQGRMGGSLNIIPADALSLLEHRCRRV